MKFLAGLFKPQCRNINHLISDGVRCVLNDTHEGDHFARLGKTEKVTW